MCSAGGEHVDSPVCRTLGAGRRCPPAVRPAAPSLYRNWQRRRLVHCMSPAHGIKGLLSKICIVRLACEAIHCFGLRHVVNLESDSVEVCTVVLY